MSDKPSYLGLLNAVSNGETAAHQYLSAWLQVTRHEGVRKVIGTVCAREGEHGLAFAKRIDELGYQLICKEDPEQARRMEVACSTELSDLQKMEAFKLGREPKEGPDVFSRFFEDPTIDPQTGALLGRYVCEERDSGRLLRACYEQLCAEAGQATGAAATPSADLRRLEDKVDTVCRAVDELRQIVCAQAMAAEPVPA